MRGPVVIFGADGYIGWPLALHLGVETDDAVVLVDNFATRRLVASVRSDSLVPIRSMAERLASYRESSGRDNLTFVAADARDPGQVDRIISRFEPESVVHLAQQRSAPFSMVDQEHALYTQQANVATNLNILLSLARHAPGAHLVKMGSMGEYGTPGVTIQEGDIEFSVMDRKGKAIFPRNGQSWYHLSKIYDTYNVLLANRVYGVRATDVMQGVVYGSRAGEAADDALSTRFDFDSIWGTLINKYVVQSVVLKKLLIYGRGLQKRGFLSLYDSIKCLSLLLEKPPKEGQYRVVNQLDEIYDTLRLAEMVRETGEEFGVKAEMQRVANPRVESEEHFYEVEHRILPALGFRREKEMPTVLREIFELVMAHRERAEKMKHLIYPTVSWRNVGPVSSPAFPMPKELMRVQDQEELRPLALLGSLEEAVPARRRRVGESGGREGQQG